MEKALIPRDCTKMSDREGIVMTAAIMIVVALKGNDEDVKMALKSDAVSKTALAMKYFQDATIILDILHKNQTTYIITGK